MKRKAFIVIILALFLLTGCKNKQEESLKKQEDIVKEEIKEISNITIQKLRDNLSYIKDNYENISDEETFTKVAYSTKYIQTIGVYEDKNEVEILTDNATEYLKKQNKETKEKLEDSFKKINDKEDKLLEELYNSYMKNEVVKNLIEDKKELVKADVKDKNLLTSSNINTYYTYIENHLNKPFKNNEVIEYLVYYSLFFKESESDSLLSALGAKTIRYLQDLNTKDLFELQNMIKMINKNKQDIIDGFIKSVE